MKSEANLIGLFEGMFEGNILTFNPGWNQNAEEIADFEDVRQLQQHIKSSGINTDPEIDIKGTGPASFTITDPDGNKILIDQHR